MVKAYQEDLSVKVGIIACGKYWYTGCPGLNSHVLCFDAMRERQGPLGQIPEARLVSYRPCPGCPGDGLLGTARQVLQEDGADIITFGSCCFLLENCDTVYRTAEEIQKLGCQVVLGSYLKPNKKLNALPDRYLQELTEHRSVALRFLNFCSWISAIQAGKPGAKRKLGPGYEVFSTKSPRSLAPSSGHNDFKLFFQPYPWQPD